MILKQIIFQSSSETKNCDNRFKLLKVYLKKIFKQASSVLKKLNRLFYWNLKMKYSKVLILTLNSKLDIIWILQLEKGYLKSPHLDRRDHLISGIFYPISDV